MTNGVRRASWLHLSDVHFKAGVSYDRDVVTKALLTSLPHIMLRAGRPDFIVFSGDVSDSGKRDQYESATLFFDNLLEITALDRARLIVVPGNHDVDRQQGVGLSRTLKSSQEADEYFSTKSKLLHVTERLGSFRDWYNGYFDKISIFPENTTCLPIRQIPCQASKVAILPINTATFCADDNDSGKLWIGRACVNEFLEQLGSYKDNLRLIVTHHPLSWLNQEEISNIKTAFRTVADCVLSGHLHETDIEHVVGLNGNCYHLCAGAAYQTRKWPNTAMMCYVEEDILKVTPLRYYDKPREIWTVDPSVFPDEHDFTRNYKLMIYDDIINSQQATVLKGSTLISNDEIVEAKIDFERDLFVTPSGSILYAEPYLMGTPQEFRLEAGSPAEFSISDIVQSEDSLIISARAEFGSTSLSKRLQYESIEAGRASYLRNARELPNYRRKLEASFPKAAQLEGANTTLILDHFDPERDERLIRELAGTEWFSRIILVTVDRSMVASMLAMPELPNRVFRSIYLWSVQRSEIRSMAIKLFQSADDVFISRVVDKIYRDLLGLCIPVTPANAIMYLRILHREGEFHPLNRVDILGRYIQEILRKAGDVSVDAFNAKNKVDVIAEFAFKLFSQSKDNFDMNYWVQFCNEHQEKTLFEFNSVYFFNELQESRIFVNFNGEFYFKYSFFFSFFLGRGLVSRPDRMRDFLNNHDFLKVDGIVDVLSGLSSDNGQLVGVLTNILKGHLEKFSTEYIESDFDPIDGAVWAKRINEDEHLWNPVARAIAAGPRSTREIDILKTSLIEESRTADQRVRFDKFLELENALFYVANLLEHALRNADDVLGPAKLEALDCILRSHHTALQVGTVFADKLARKRIFKWGGLEFVDFHNEKIDTPSPKEIFDVVFYLYRAVSRRAADELGAHKLTPLLRAHVKNSPVLSPSFALMVFRSLLTARGAKWANTAEDIINNTDFSAYVLAMMLDTLMLLLRNEILKTNDRDAAKRLVALIQAKRQHNRKAPGSKAVGHMLRILEDNAHFDTPKSEDKSSEDPL